MDQGIDAGRSRGYRVRIVYTEPEFQRRNPQCPPEFISLFDFPGAFSRDDAVRQALSEWDFYLRHTRVGWTRAIKSVLVESLPG